MVKLTPESKAKIRELHGQGLKLDLIAAEVGVNASTVSRFLTFGDDYTKQRSLRNRIETAIRLAGKYATPGEILLDIAKPSENIDLHNVVHLIWALQKQGKVKFRETKGIGDTTALWDIEWVRREKAKPVLAEPQVSITEEIRSISEKNRRGYPILSALWRREDNVQKARRLLVAAGLKETAIRVVQEGALTDLELETLAYLRVTGFKPDD